ncbi:Uma2 family endonuclease [Pendulispora albinea]|uniref:Uma2 family endonuclease n=1 Tax=Pendulispora albinea TaxID=2741071 RepID=A0ABZ2LXH1_9BACT
MVQSAVPRLSHLPQARYLREPAPLHFPEEELMPEGYDHLLLRSFLFELLRFVLGSEHSVQSEQFVYWNPRSPKRCIAPDVCVKLGVPQSHAGTWKTWERGGPPDLAIEIISPTTTEKFDWEEKLVRYHELGIRELVRFDPDDPPGSRLRVWDLLEGDLVERRVEGESTHCTLLRLTWAVRPVADLPEGGLRLLDANGNVVLSALETEKAHVEVERLRAEAAEARIRQLEEELRRKGRE